MVTIPPGRSSGQSRGWPRPQLLAHRPAQLEVAVRFDTGERIVLDLT